MQHVKKGWLDLICAAFVVGDILLWLGYIYFEATNADKELVAYWGITEVILAIATAHILYSVLIYPWLRKRSVWIASVISLSMWGILLSTLIETSGQTNYYYRFGLVVYFFIASSTGYFLPIAGIVLAWIIYFFTYSGVVGESTLALTYYTGLNILNTVSGLIGWMFFKKHYDANDDPAVQALSSQLEEEQFKASVILESITDGVLVIDKKGVIQIANVSAARMLGWTKEEITQLDYHSLIKPVDEVDSKPEKEAISLSLQTGKPAQKVTKLETLHNRQMYIDIVASPIIQTTKNESNEEEKVMSGVIAVLRDVDSQKREEAQKSDFISTASHEMRTPIASIQGYLELALNPKISQIDAKTKLYLDKAYESTKHLGQLFQDLLTVSRSEDGHLNNHPQTIDINKLVREVIESLAKRATEKGLKLQFTNDVAGIAGERKLQPELVVMADPERLREVISNLIENGIKYTTAGAVAVTTTLKDDHVLIQVSDTGMGIAEEDLTHLFQKFYRVDTRATREVGGTGLGLYISKQIIEMLGGTITVSSTLGKGSVFTVDLPRASETKNS